jgi:hypothetical protein
MDNLWLPGADPMPPGQRQAMAVRAGALQQSIVNIVENVEHRLPQDVDRFFLPRYPGEPREFMMRWHAVDRIVRLCRVQMDEMHWLYVFSVVNHFLQTVSIRCVAIEKETDALGNAYYKLFVASGTIYNMTRVLVTGIWDDPDSQIVMTLGFPYELLASKYQEILETLEDRVYQILHPAPVSVYQFGQSFPNAAGQMQ